MEKIIVKGGKRLTGKVKISGSKNATLPIMSATLLTRGKNIIRNVPDLLDVKTMAQMLEILGAKVYHNKQEKILEIDTSNCEGYEAPYELVKTMRASIYVLGPLLAKLKKAKVSLPGGCAWGPRPVDLHIKGMEMLGAEITLEHGYINATANKLKGTRICFDISSVGATGNIMMAGVLAEGKTIIENSAREPEIEGLAHCLVSMGAIISGMGTDRIEIEGVKELKEMDYTVIPDRIETGTYAVAGAITKGDIIIEDCIPEHNTAVISKLRLAGVTVEEVIEDSKSATATAIRIKNDSPNSPVDILTAPYPGFPTDMQAQMMALMSITKGTSIITDTIYPDRFMHVPELNRLGANIRVDGNSAIVQGVDHLTGAPVMATDLRASASLILAGLVAEGETTIDRVYHLDRGYEKVEEKLKGLGAEISRQ